jgi:hypothetical protein
MMDDDTKYCFFLGINGMRVQPEPPAGHCSAMLCQAKVATFEWHKRKKTQRELITRVAQKYSWVEKFSQREEYLGPVMP